jgi:hypothetical protein
MPAFLRLIGMIVLLQLLAWGMLAAYLASLHRERLEHRWDRLHPAEAGDRQPRRAFVRRAMREYMRVLRPRLAVGVIVLPLVAILAIIIVVNHD